MSKYDEMREKKREREIERKKEYGPNNWFFMRNAQINPLSQVTKVEKNQTL